MSKILISLILSLVLTADAWGECLDSFIIDESGSMDNEFVVSLYPAIQVHLTYLTTRAGEIHLQLADVEWVGEVEPETANAFRRTAVIFNFTTRFHISFFKMESLKHSNLLAVFGDNNWHIQRAITGVTSVGDLALVFLDFFYNNRWRDF